MGVGRRKDSPYYWLTLERPGQRPLRESTKIRVDGPTAFRRKQNRMLAEQVYHERMTKLARDRYRIPGASLDDMAQPASVRPLQTSLDGWCYVYFVRAGDAVKIGRARNPTARVTNIKTANHEELQMLAAVPAHAALETAIHERFSDSRLHGEWFRLTPELEEFIGAVARGTNPVALLF